MDDTQKSVRNPFARMRRCSKNTIRVIPKKQERVLEQASLSTLSLYQLIFSTFRCDFHKFFYSKSSDVRLDGAYALDVPEGRDHLTKKTMEALRISFNFYK